MRRLPPRSSVKNPARVGSSPKNAVRRRGTKAVGVLPHFVVQKTQRLPVPPQIRRRGTKAVGVLATSCGSKPSGCPFPPRIRRRQRLREHARPQVTHWAKRPVTAWSKSKNCPGATPGNHVGVCDLSSHRLPLEGCETPIAASSNPP